VTQYHSSTVPQFHSNCVCRTTQKTAADVALLGRIRRGSHTVLLLIAG
jgi:hypothetical protein